MLRPARRAPVGDLRQLRPELAAAPALQQPGALGDQQRAVEYTQVEQDNSAQEQEQDRPLHWHGSLHDESTDGQLSRCGKTHGDVVYAVTNRSPGSVLAAMQAYGLDVHEHRDRLHFLDAFSALMGTTSTAEVSTNVTATVGRGG